jgi:hypothetical protein
VSKAALPEPIEPAMRNGPDFAGDFNPITAILVASDLPAGKRAFGLPASGSNSRDERLAPWRWALRPRRTAERPADWER